VPRQGQDARCVPPDVTAGDHWSRSNLGEEFMVPALNESVTCFNHFICCLFSVWISVHVFCMNLCKDVESCCSLPLAHCHWLSRDCCTTCMKKMDNFCNSKSILASAERRPRIIRLGRPRRGDVFRVPVPNHVPYTWPRNKIASLKVVSGILD
jgi:hypothetical protein